MSLMDATAIADIVTAVASGLASLPPLIAAMRALAAVLSEVLKLHSRPGELGQAVSVNDVLHHPSTRGGSPYGHMIKRRQCS